MRPSSSVLVRVLVSRVAVGLSGARRWLVATVSPAPAFADASVRGQAARGAGWLPDPREVVPPFGASRFWSYVTATSVAGLGVAVAVVCAEVADRPFRIEADFVVIAVLTLVAGLRPLGAAGWRDPGGTDPTLTFLFAIVLTWGVAPAVVVHLVVSGLLARARGRAPWRVGFNLAQYALSYAAAGVVARQFGLGPDLSVADLPGVAASASTLFAVNYLLVGIAVALHEGRSFLDALCADLRYHLAVHAALLSVSPLVVVAAARSVWLVPLLLPALWAVGKVGEISLQKEHLALHDELTGLPNRALLSERASAGLAAAARSGRRVGLFLLDLDRFKEVNDTLGHHVGDRLLVVVSARLSGALRPGDTVARLGGDEFAVLLPGLPAGEAGRSAALEVADRVRAVLRVPYELDGTVVDVDASLGVALHPDHGHDMASLLQCADLAMYVAKEHHHGVQMYGPREARRTSLRARTAAELYYALEHNQLELHYQPQAEIADGRVRRVEGLLRWRHPSRGLLLPEVFVPLAESGGLIRSITSWAVAAALAQLTRWRADGLEIAVALNASARDLRDPGFAASVAAALAANDVPPGLLTLEVTERVVFADVERAAVTLRALVEAGVSVSLDDFGTGASSLDALRRLPFHEIKVDRTFVRRMEADARDARFVRALVRLGSELGLRVVAEGVETPTEWTRLAHFGADAAQGWHVAPALPAALLPGWLVSHRPVDTATGLQVPSPPPSPSTSPSPSPSPSAASQSPSQSPGSCPTSSGPPVAATSPTKALH